MVFIRDVDHKVISRSRNLRGLLELSRKRRVLGIYAQRLPDGGGSVRVEFLGGAYCQTTFASFNVMFERFFIRPTFYDVPIYINDKPCGLLGRAFEQNQY